MLIIVFRFPPPFNPGTLTDHVEYPLIVSVMEELILTPSWKMPVATFGHEV